MVLSAAFTPYHLGMQLSLQGRSRAVSLPGHTLPQNPQVNFQDSKTVLYSGIYELRKPRPAPLE